MSVNYDRVCRLCLSSRGELLPIFPTTSSDDTEPPVLATKIKDCVSVQISENDDLPTNVCRKCMDNVNNWHIFKSVCERTQNKLESLIKDGNQLEQVKIKSEPLSDEPYDDGVVIDGSYPDSENASSSTKMQPEGPPILASLGLTPRSDKKYVDPRMDWPRVHAILDMVQDDEVIDALQCTEESDILQHSDHDSDSEIELQPLVDDTFINCKNGYICKNRQVISRNPKLTSHGVIKKKEVITLRKRKLEQIGYCGRPRSAWQKFFTEDLLDLIVTSTNCNIQKNSNVPPSSITNITEIKSLIGILYLHGILRPTHQKCSDLWHMDLGIPCVKNAMDYERFKFLLRNICFDKDDDDNIIQFDVMKRMRKVFEIFALNCRTVFDAGNSVVIDEIVVPVYGPCPFRYSIDKKPLKSGIKMVLLVDPSTFYVSNLDVITDPYFGAEDIVKKLVQHLAGTGKTIVMDSWFTSIPLTEHLIKEYQLLTIAALNPNDDIIPPLFVSEYRKCGTLLTGFLDEDITLTSYVNSESKSVNVVTSEPQFHKRGHVRHNAVVSLYKKNQSAVEVVDVLMHYYTTMQNTNDWTLSLFFTLLNIAAINSQVIWTSQNSGTIIKRRSFLNELAISLLDQSTVSSIMDIVCDKTKTPVFEVPYKNRKRCRICVKTTKRDRRTRQFCLKCGQFICKEHTLPICSTCGTS